MFTELGRVRVRVDIRREIFKRELGSEARESVRVTYLSNGSAIAKRREVAMA
jgi:hypothetical protein